MKKLLMGSIVVSLVLSGCAQEGSDEKVVTKVEDTQGNKKESRKIQGSQINPQVQSRYTVLMNSTEGEAYTLHVFSNNEQHEAQKESWVGAQEGDQIYKGEYQLALQSTSAILYLQEAKIGEFVFNTSRKNGFVSKGTPDFFVALQRESSNFSTVKAFYIHRGKVLEVKIDEDDFGITGTCFKALDKGKFLIGNYDNGEGMWYFSTFQTDLETGKAKRVDQKKLPLEEGNVYVKDNFK
ncbi:Uncharacterized protein BC141101_00162 [Bacillus toyonensis]|uniref:hypothetical protein n=1 Tax=Bacillus TaxID=1386 RepID=UPI0001A0B90E|nr:MULTISPECIES: hypothetical protein [Bacillus cereus group]EEL41773.1 hypothetical protein bcere0020_7710 [Bacillus cereus Rock3-29]KAB0449483.1 hypothetical protein CH334_04290 [Lysinibacillus sp. VIA-II-2016]EJV44042.1 hypothetical protein IEA_04524 [Bacillus toyonensis]EJV92512.1 hypothetical protein IGI_04516 [Bacillus toyonensis]EOP45326.1 hypothetical protein IKI_00170 [Bacillus toyonensis]